MCVAQVPGTAYALDHMRPDMVQLMALGRALVMWETIEPTEVRAGAVAMSWLDPCRGQGGPPRGGRTGGGGGTQPTQAGEFGGGGCPGLTGFSGA
jgi:hypothetical protein